MRDGIRLQVAIGDTVLRPVPETVADALISAHITQGGTDSGGFQLHFAAGQRSELTRSLLPAGYFAPKRRVVLTIIVAGVATVLSDGIITDQDVAPSGEPSASTLTVTGQDLRALMDLVERTRTFPSNQPLDALVRSILDNYRSYGINADAAKPPLDYAPNTDHHTMTQRGTDLAYLQSLAHDVGHEFTLIPGPTAGSSTARWGPRPHPTQIQPALSVGMGPDRNIEQISFGFRGLRATSYTHNGEPAHPQNLDELRPRLTRTPAAELRSQPLPPTRTAQRALLTSSLVAASKDTVTAQGSLDVLAYGSILGIDRLVGVRGAGVSHDGLFAVTTVDHTITRSSYTQQFTLTRDGLGSLDTTVVPQAVL